MVGTLEGFMEKKCFFCGNITLNEKYYFLFSGTVYEIFPGFNDFFNLCNICNQGRVEALFDNFKIQEIEVEKIIEVVGDDLQVNWMEFYLLKQRLKKSHRSEVWDLCDDLMDVLVCLGFITFRPNGNWMFDSSYNLVHYLGNRLYFKTKESAINFCNAERQLTENFSRVLIKIEEVIEVQFN